MRVQTVAKAGFSGTFSHPTGKAKLVHKRSGSSPCSLRGTLATQLLTWSGVCGRYLYFKMVRRPAGGERLPRKSSRDTERGSACANIGVRKPGLFHANSSQQYIERHGDRGHARLPAMTTRWSATGGLLVRCVLDRHHVDAARSRPEKQRDR